MLLLFVIMELLLHKYVAKFKKIIFSLKITMVLKIGNYFLVYWIYKFR